MRILTGYLVPTGGAVSVAGYNVALDPLPARRLIGYLPEGAPLYPDMAVEGYLEFIASMRLVPRRRRRSAIGRAVELCRLEDVLGKTVSELSRGYRQRLGLAQAIVHDPDVLILDEPTAGLDPNQIAELRKTIANLGAEKTVILSTHILSEVEAVCRRAIVIHQGRIVADGPLGSLRGGGSLEEAFGRLTGRGTSPPKAEDR